MRFRDILLLCIFFALSAWLCFALPPGHHKWGTDKLFKLKNAAVAQSFSSHTEANSVAQRLPSDPVAALAEQAKSLLDSFLFLLCAGYFKNLK